MYEQLLRRAQKILNTDTPYAFSDEQILEAIKVEAAVRGCGLRARREIVRAVAEKLAPGLR